MRSAWAAGWPPQQTEADAGPRDRPVVVEATGAGSMAGGLDSEEREQLRSKSQADGGGRCGRGNVGCGGDGPALAHKCHGKLLHALPFAPVGHARRAVCAARGRGATRRGATRHGVPRKLRARACPIPLSLPPLSHELTQPLAQL